MDERAYAREGFDKMHDHERRAGAKCTGACPKTRQRASRDGHAVDRSSDAPRTMLDCRAGAREAGRVAGTTLDSSQNSILSPPVFKVDGALGLKSGLESNTATNAQDLNSGNRQPGPTDVFIPPNIASSNIESIFDGVPEPETDVDTDAAETLSSLSIDPGFNCLWDLDTDFDDTEPPHRKLERSSPHSLSTVSSHVSGDVLDRVSLRIHRHNHAPCIELEELSIESELPPLSTPPFTEVSSNTLPVTLTDTTFLLYIDAEPNELANDFCDFDSSLNYEDPKLFDVESYNAEPPGIAEHASPPAEFEFVVTGDDPPSYQDSLFVIYFAIRALFRRYSTLHHKLKCDQYKPVMTADASTFPDQYTTVEIPSEAVPPDKTSDLWCRILPLHAKHFYFVFHLILSWLNSFWEDFFGAETTVEVLRDYGLACNMKSDHSAPFDGFPEFKDTITGTYDQDDVEIGSEPVLPDKSFIHFNFDSFLSSKDFVDSKLISTFPQGFEDKISG
ncbi:hypothetical protein B0H16DRAFT_1463289 [Mycena metata]|uniref:Uncharacterized protein n=1 Tax=Mycena metata TaxID=1033252 RepID=A0AAD7N376_9AGAR|nr:hypothetical protein B0H16DRAFT_1463289 [Mycena metata]